MRSRVSDGIWIVIMGLIALTALASALPTPHAPRVVVHVRLAKNKIHSRLTTGESGTVFTQDKSQI